MNFLRRKSKLPSFARRQSAPNHPLSESPLHQERKEAGGGSSEVGESEDVRKHMFSIREHNHSDVSDVEGWILIPNQRLPDDWSDAVEMKVFRSLDRSFVFPGEHLHILACLTPSKQYIDIASSSITSKEIQMNSGFIEINKEKMTSGSTQTSSTCGIVDIDSEKQEVYSDMPSKANISTKEEFSTVESLIQLEEHKNQTCEFNNSDFFVRISESGEPLWSKISKEEAAQASDNESRESLRKNLFNTNIDSGTFNPYAFCGLARNAAKCYSLQNGDIAVLLQVNVGIDNIKDPVLEVLQFVKSKTSYLSSQHSQAFTSHHDPNRENLRWVIPLESTSTPIPPRVSSKSSSVGFVPDSGSEYLRSPLSISSSSSQLFSFSNFKTYSMPSLPPTSSLSVSSHPRPSFDLEGLDQVSFKKLVNNQVLKMEIPLSFRGVYLEPEKFSVQCGLSGVYLPGKRWRKKLEIIQPIEMHSFAADCNTENLLCVQIKNICPSHIPEMIIYLDAINIIYEEAPMYGSPLFLPFSCIEAGGDHSLPNLALRRGEEHSFILKPSHHYSNIKEGANNLTIGNSVLNLPKYAVLVSYKCNYAESKLFFKKPTSWRPHAANDLMLSVESVISEQIDEPEKSSQLPFQVLTLQASNLTAEDLTLSVLAPASFTTSPYAFSLDSVPRTPVERVSTIGEGGSTPNDPMLLPGAKKKIINLVMGSFSVDEDLNESSIPNYDSNYTHLWRQSTVSLGNHTRLVPARSSVTFKLQSLPLTDGIITLDTLQVLVKEKGVTYVPEHPLKIYAPSSSAIKI